MDREGLFIAKLQDSGVALRLDDDGIALGGQIYAMDLFAEGVHFTRPQFSCYQVAKKAMLVNVSDILAMGARPQFALLGVTFAADMTPRDIDGFVRGIAEVCRDYGIRIIGGDTIKGKKLSVAVTMFGTARRFLLERRGFKSGDVVFYTGRLGSVAKDMRLLYRGAEIRADSRFFAPKLRGDFMLEVARFARGAMDISDGLFFEFNRISKLCGVRFRLFKKVKKHIGVSGEEYEMLFSVRARDARRVGLLAKKHRVKITKIAKMLPGRQRFPAPPHHR